jgi:hypothetical protein
MNIVYKIVLILFFINSYSQIVPLNNIETPQGAYEKDLDNILPFWVGTWKGVINNNEYTFVFNLFPNTLINYGFGTTYYRDELMIKFSVKDLNTNIIRYSDLNVTDYNDYKISFAALLFNGDYVFIFRDSVQNCFNGAEFTLIKNNLNQIEFRNFSFLEFLYFDDCPYTNRSQIPFFLPDGNFILTRQ